MFSRFFIHRPIFASVLSIVVTLAGGIAVWCCPWPSIRRSRRRRWRYPPPIPAPIRRRGGHRGRPHRAAGQRRRGDAVHVAPVRQRRQLHADGHLQAGRRSGHGPGARAEPRRHGQPVLPDLVNRNGVKVKKKSPSVLMIVNLFSPDGSRRQPRPEQLRHDPTSRRTARLAGVGRHHLPRAAR